MADVKNFMVGNDEKTIAQIATFAGSFAYGLSKIRIMPDAHAGKGAVVGSTMTFDRWIVPATVGVDIACRVSAFNLGHEDIDFEKLDRVARRVVPTGFNVRAAEANYSAAFPYEQLFCWNELKNQERLRLSMGTLGGGNHFIELDYDADNDNYWLVIHSGSRNLGKQVAEFYQNIAIARREERIADMRKVRELEIAHCRLQGRFDKIEQVKHTWDIRISQEPVNDLCYIEGEDMAHYLNDMRICNEFSRLSHQVIFDEIAREMLWDDMYECITCIHNYVDVDNHIIRKGAIAAYEGQLGIIPLNMRDGVLLVRAKGNEDWNCSLPHGAGRVMSRMEARRELCLADFQREMEGIVSSSVVADTIDEAPMAYKDAAAIVEAIRPNADILVLMKPVWSFKAC